MTDPSDLPRERITDLTLFVRTSSEEMSPWNRERIVDALMRETPLDYESAVAISREIEDFIFRSGLRHITTPLIRELVDTKLIERGFEGIYRRHRRLGVPVYDVENLLFHSGKENANIPHSPEASSHILSELIKKEYALEAVFSPEVRDAHIRGDIHIHGLGFIDRPYSTYQNLEGLKEGGLDLSFPPVKAGPARHADALLSQMIRLSSLLQAHYAASIGWYGVNLSFAPYLRGMDYRGIRQIAQRMVFEFSQLGAGRGGQAIFSTIHIDLKPSRGATAIGPGGSRCGTYGDYRKEARLFAMALMEVYREGDASGKPLFFPQPWFHIWEETLEDRELLSLLLAVCQEKGVPHILFERGDGRTLLEGPFPSISILQNVSINLPRIGYRIRGGQDPDRELERVVEIAIRAHVEKREFLRRLAEKEKGPLSFVVEKGFFSPDRAVAFVGIIGLPEYLHIIGKEGDGGEAAGVLKRLERLVTRMGKRHMLQACLTQTPGESTAHRFAKLDLKYHAPLSGRNIRGDIAKGEIYYNTSLLPISSEVEPFERARYEGALQPHIRGETFTNIYLEGRPFREDFIERLFRKTGVRSISLSPDFTLCMDCGISIEGIRERCGSCGSSRVDYISRVTTYYSLLSNWNRGKVGEWKERFRWKGW